MLVPLVFTLVLAGALDDDKDFQNGIREYRELNFESALTSFAKAARNPHITDDQATIQLWTGLCHAGLGDEDQAREALRRAVSLNAGVDIPNFTPPRVREILAEELAILQGKPLPRREPPPPPPPPPPKPDPEPVAKPAPPPPPDPTPAPDPTPTPPPDPDAGDIAPPPPPGPPSDELDPNAVPSETPGAYEEMPTRGPLTPPDAPGLGPNFGWGVLATVVGVAAAGGTAVFLFDIARVESEILAIDDQLRVLPNDDPARDPLLARRAQFQQAGAGDISGAVIFGLVALTSLGVGAYLLADSMQ